MSFLNIPTEKTHLNIIIFFFLLFLLLQPPLLQKNVEALEATDDGIDLIILLDQSSSMSKGGENTQPTDPDNLRVDAARYLIEYLAFDNASVNPHRVNRVVVIGFGTYAELLVNLTTLNSEENVEAAKSQIVSQDLGYTNFSSALEMVREVFPPATDAELANNARRRIIVVITDGEPFDCRSFKDDDSRACPERWEDDDPFEIEDYFVEIEEYYEQELGIEKYPLYIVGIDKFNQYWENGLKVEPYWRAIASNPEEPEQRHTFRTLNSNELTSKILDFLCPFLGDLGVSRDCRIVELGTHFIPPYADMVRFNFFKYRDDSEISLYWPDAQNLNPNPDSLPNQTLLIPPADDANINVEYEVHDRRTESYQITSPPAGCWQTSKRGDGRVDVLTDISFKNSLEMVEPSAPHSQLEPLQLAFKATYENGNPIEPQPGFDIRFEAQLFDPDGNPVVAPIIEPDGNTQGSYVSTNDLQTPMAGKYTGSIAGFVDIPDTFGCFEPESINGRTLRLFDMPFEFEVTAPNLQVTYPNSAHLQYAPLDKIVIDAVNDSGSRIPLPEAPAWSTEATVTSPSGKEVVIPSPVWLSGSYVIGGPMILDETGTYTVTLTSRLPDGYVFHEAQSFFNTIQNIVLLSPPSVFPIYTPILTTSVQLLDGDNQPIGENSNFSLRIEAEVFSSDGDTLEIIPLEPVANTVPGHYALVTDWEFDAAEPYSIHVTGYIQPEGGDLGQPGSVAFVKTFVVTGSDVLPRFEVVKPAEGLSSEENLYALHGGWSDWFQFTPMVIEIELYQGESLVAPSVVFKGDLTGLLTASIEDGNGTVLYENVPLTEFGEGRIGVLALELTELKDVGDYQVRLHLSGELLNGDKYEGVVPDVTVPFRLHETPLYLTVRVVVITFLTLLVIVLVVLLSWFIWGFLPPYPHGILVVKITGIGHSGETIQEFSLNRGGIKRKKVVIHKNISSRLKLDRIVVRRATQAQSQRGRKAKSMLTGNQGGSDREEIIELEAYGRDDKKKRVASGKLYGLRGNRVPCSQTTDDGKRYEFTYKQ